MARFNLNKGERFSLKKSEGLSKIKVVLGWVKPANTDGDLDVCAFLTGKDGIIENDADFVFYNSDNRVEAFNKDKFGNKKKWKDMVPPVSADGSVIGSLDDKGDDDNNPESSEEMHVDLGQVGAKINEIVFCVSVYEESITFGQVTNAYISIINEENGQELCRYDLKENFSNETAVVAGSLVCDAEGEWSFEAKGKGYTGGTQTLIDLYA